MNNYQELTKKQLSFFRSGKTKDVAFRIETLKKLRELVVRHEDDILKAVKLTLTNQKWKQNVQKLALC